MQYERGDWYDQYIEDPLKGIIRYLRNNGINTEISCGHEKSIHCQFINTSGWAIHTLHNLVSVYLLEHPGELGFDGVSFTIEAKHWVMNSHQRSSICLSFPPYTLSKSRHEIASNSNSSTTSCITAGSLREIGAKIPDNIPDMAWVLGESIISCDQNVEGKRSCYLQFTKPFQWVEVDVPISAEKENG